MVFPLLAVGFAIAGAVAGARDAERRQQSKAVINSVPAREMQESRNNVVSFERTEPQQANSDLLECPPIYVPERYQANVDAALDIIHDCGVWNDFCRVVSAVKHDPSATTAQMVGYGANPGGKQQMEIGTEILGMKPVNLAFAMLHEIWHGLERYNGKDYAEEAEENAANNYAGSTLQSHGYSHDFVILPNGTVGIQNPSQMLSMSKLSIINL